jgi:molecular chaperone DnaJ
MSEKHDYYDLLGVQRDATSDEIRRAYRQAALKYHPDRNPGDKAAEDRFKEATEAYSVLSDDEKRSVYDRYGHAGLSGRGGFDVRGAPMADILSHFQDVFADFFGGFGGFGGSGRQRRAPERGQDIRVAASITLKEAFTGVKKELVVRGSVPCETCGGSGGKPGTKPVRCGQCGGSGQVTSHRGFIMFSTTCPACGGMGQRVEEPCGACSGQGAVLRERKVLVSFPAGIDTGQRLRVTGQGIAGPPGAPPGDLYVDTEVEPDERYSREGNDLLVRESVSFATAALGGAIEVELPDGSTISTKIKPGTQPGTLITVHGRGVPRLDRQGRGDVHIMVNVQVPVRVSKHARKLLEELERELGDADSERRAVL